MNKKAVIVGLVVPAMLIGSLSYKVNAVEINKLIHQETRSDDDYSFTYNVQGLINGDDTVETSYPGTDSVPEFYNTYLTINDGAEKRVTDIQNNVAKEVETGINLTHKLTMSNSDKTLTVDYILENTTAADINYKLATTSDIEFCDNDLAAVYKTGKDKIVITQDDKDYADSYKTQLHISIVTPASTIWLGRYSYIPDNKYVDSTETKFTELDKVDTGMVWSWNGSVKAGESVTKTVVFNLQEAETGKVELTDLNGNVTEHEDLVGGTLILPEPTGEVEEGYEIVYNTKEDGTGTTYKPGEGFLVETKDAINIYEFKRKIGTTLLEKNAPQDDKKDEENAENGEKDNTPKTGSIDASLPICGMLMAASLFGIIKNKRD